MVKATKVTISERALIQRINRKLKVSKLVLKKPRAGNLGDYYLVDLSLNAVVETDVDIKKLAKELSAMAPYETFEK